MGAPNTTPGPWVAKGGRVETAEPSASVAAAIESFVTGIHGTRSISRNEARANAHLIASAPELYEALEAIMLAVESGHAAVRNGLVADALSALAKARGEA